MQSGKHPSVADPNVLEQKSSLHGPFGGVFTLILMS
jgi:hypothetical protein